MDTNSAVTAIDAAMAALQLARNALTENKPEAPAPAPSKPKIIWREKNAGRINARYGSNIVTVMRDMMHRDEYCILYNLDGEEGIRKSKSLDTAKQIGEQMLLTGNTGREYDQ